jgi:hypothetical protein
MIEIPKLVVILLVGFLVWYAMRWVNGSSPRVPPRRRPAAPPPPPKIEDLVACPGCGAYVATGARGCGKPGCPQPR